MAETKNTINALVDGLVSSRNILRDKLGNAAGGMNLVLNDGTTLDSTKATLAQVAEAATKIVVEEVESEPRYLDANTDAYSFAGGKYLVGDITVGYKKDDQYMDGTAVVGGGPVYATDEVQTFDAAKQTLITQFQVAAVPTITPTITVSQIIGSGADGENLTHTITPPQQMINGALRNQYYNEVTIPKVMLGEYAAAYNDVYNAERTEDIIIDKTDLTTSDGQTFDWSGVSKVTIPKPNPENYDQTYDLMTREITVTRDENDEIVASDTTINLNSGFISASEIIIEIGEVYKALAEV